MKKTLLVVVSFILLFLIVFGFKSVPIKIQLPMLTDLLQISAILFAILGVWVAVLDPTTLLNKLPTSELTPRSKLALDFIPLLMVTTLVFILVVIIKFTTPLLILLLSSSTKFAPFYRGILGAVITVLFIAEIWVVIGTLMPLAKVLKKVREDKLKEKYRK